MDSIIEVSNLHKSYGEIKAIDGIDFYVERGKLFSFLGPNGAGKSTTIDIICTFLKPDLGEIKVDGNILGKEDSEIRKIIGAVFQDGVLDDLLSVEDNLKVRGGFYGLKGSSLTEAIKNTAELTGITELLKRPYGKLSGGQKRRCDIARALINTPKILFLDEPTTGLDPQTRKTLWETIIKIQRQSNMTIFLTTHYMEEAGSSDYVIIIDKGKITAKGTPAELKSKYSRDKLILFTKNTDTISNILNSRRINYDLAVDTFKINLTSTLEALPLIELCKEYIFGFEVLKGTMDDAFISITGREIRE